MRFTIRSAKNADWMLVNDLIYVKNGVSFSEREMLAADQANAFLQAIIRERKELAKTLQIVTSELGDRSI